MRTQQIQLMVARVMIVTSLQFMDVPVINAKKEHVLKYSPVNEVGLSPYDVKIRLKGSE